MSIAVDILEATQLAARGGCGPVGPDGKVMVWSQEGRTWTSDE